MTKWSDHVKKHAKKHKMSYREASMDSKCKESYRKKSKKRMSPRKMSKKRMSPREMSKKRMSPRKMSKKKGSARKRMNSYEDYARTKTPEELGEELIVASFNGDFIEAGVLIQYGADVNYEDSSNRTPLYAASARSKPDIIELLIDNGAEIDHRGPNGNTALLVAVKNYRLGQGAKVLIERGADVNISSNSGTTPLYIAAKYIADIDIVKDLIEKGADVNVVDDEGVTPCQATESDEIKRYLKDHGANC